MNAVSKQFNLIKCIGYLLCWRSWSVVLFLQAKVGVLKNSARSILSNLRSENLNSRARLLAHVAQVVAVKNFPRVAVGLVCLVWLAPYADVFYTRLDFYVRVPASEWYYESYHWLFLCLGPYLKGIFGPANSSPGVQGPDDLGRIPG